RGTPGVQRTHGPRHLAAPRHLQFDNPQVRHLSGVPRAAFGRLSFARPPVDLPFQAPSPAGAAKPIHRYRGIPVNRSEVPQNTQVLWPPATRGSARRDRATSAAALWVCVLHPCAATAPDPHFVTL